MANFAASLAEMLHFCRVEFKAHIILYILMYDHLSVDNNTSALLDYE